MTGGGAGLGRAIAMRLAEAGPTVVIGDLHQADAEAAATHLAQFGGQHHGIGMDVRDHDSITALAELAVARTGRLDIWLNNAGIFPGGGVLEITDDDWAGCSTST